MFTLHSARLRCIWDTCYFGGFAGFPGPAKTQEIDRILHKFSAASELTTIITAAEPDNFSPFKIRAIKQKRLIKFSTAINKFMSLITLFSSYNKSRAKSSLGFDARVLLCELNAIRYIQIYIEHLLVKCWSIWLDTNEYPYLHDTYMIDRSGNLPSEPERTRRTTKFSFFSH